MECYPCLLTGNHSAATTTIMQGGVQRGLCRDHAPALVVTEPAIMNQEGCEICAEAGRGTVATHVTPSGKRVCDDCWEDFGGAAAAAKIVVREIPKRKEKQMPIYNAITQEETEKIRQLFDEGKTTQEIANAVGRHPSSVWKAMRNLGLSKRGRARGTPAAVRAKVQRKAAKVAAEIVADEAETPTVSTALTVATSANPVAPAAGPSSLRVIMFEMTGDSTAMLAALESVKAALTRAA